MLSALVGRAVVIAPARPVTVEGGTHFAWWQTDTATGETHAVGETGLYQGAFEYTIEILETVAVGLVFLALAVFVPYTVANLVVELLTCGIDYMGPAPGVPGTFLRPAPPGTRHRESGWIGGCYPYEPPPPVPSRCHPFACQGPAPQGAARG